MEPSSSVLCTTKACETIDWSKIQPSAPPGVSPSPALVRHVIETLLVAHSHSLLLCSLMVRWVIGSILYGGLIELFLVPD